MPTDVEIAWAAGLFEGEGTAQMSKRDRGTRVRVVMNDLDVLETFNRIFPGHMRTRLDARGTTQHIWQRSSADTVSEFISTILPYMHSRRTARLQAVLAQANSVKMTRGTCRNGHKIEGENNQKGECKKCAQARNKENYKKRREAKIKAQTGAQDAKEQSAREVVRC